MNNDEKQEPNPSNPEQPLEFKAEQGQLPHQVEDEEDRGHATPTVRKHGSL